MVHVGRAHHADLANDLQPTVQRIAGVGLAVHGKDGASRHSPDVSRANQAAAKRHSRPASVRNLRDIWRVLVSIIHTYCGASTRILSMPDRPPQGSGGRGVYRGASNERTRFVSVHHEAEADR
ncbi:hypothetical protein ACFPRL_01005 [Pseudoclavibacter helvolus]